MKETVFHGKQETVIFSSSCLFLLLLYMLTAPLGPTPEDSSEFILVANNLGLAHPPGYPLFTLLGKFFSFFPLGTAAQRISALSAVCISLSAWIWGKWCLKLTDNFILGWVVCLSFGLCFPNWSAGQLVEVYPLHTFLLTFTFFLAFQLSQSESTSPSFLNRSFFVGLFLGLALTNHYPLVVLSFPALLILLWRRVELIKFFPGLLLGLTLYFYLFFAHQFSDFIFSEPILNFQQFTDYVLRKEYASNDRSPVFSFLEFLRFGKISLTMLIFSFTPLSFLALLWGGGTVFSDPKLQRTALALLLGVLSSFVFLFLFWQPDFYLLTVELFETFHSFALGCFLLLCALSFKKALSGFFRKKTTALLFLIPGFLFMLNFRALNRKADNFGKDYTDLILKPLPPQSLLLAKGDKDAGFLGYFHFLEGVRPDIQLVSQVAALLPKKPFDRKFDIPRNKHTVALLNLISQHLDIEHAVFSVGPVEYFSPQKSPFPLPTKQWGLLTEIYEGSPTRVLTSSDALVTFLNRYSAPSYHANFSYYREKVFSDICHSLLTLGETHSVFETNPRCTFLKAQWVHVHDKNYLEADKLFLQALAEIKLAQDSDLAQMGKDFFINRMKMLETNQVPANMTPKTFALNTLEISVPIASQFQSCKNQLAPKILALAEENPAFQLPSRFRNIFKSCEWISAF